MDDIVYYVMETQDNGEGSATQLVTIAPTLPVALQTFHTIMAAASVSAVLRHGAIIVSSDYSYIHSELAYRIPPEPNNS